MFAVERYTYYMIVKGWQVSEKNELDSIPNQVNFW